MTTDVTNKVTRSALRFHGAKNRDAKRILRLFPPHTCYTEVFGGSAGVLLRKKPAQFEVYNDLDGRLVTFFRVLREQTAELAWRIALTPHSRQEHDEAIQKLTDPIFVACTDDLEIARLVYVAAWQTRHWPCTTWRSGWRYQHTPNRGKSVNQDWSGLDHLFAIAERLKSVQIEHGEAAQVLRRFDRPHTVHYVDPPYVQATRHKRWAGKSYLHEMDEGDHHTLADVLKGLQGLVYLSGYACDLYHDLYDGAGWARIEWYAQAEMNATRREVLWLNPAAAAVVPPQRTVQYHLFEGDGVLQPAADEEEEAG